MDMIYPSKDDSKQPVVLAAEEITLLKKSLVLAIEKRIEHPQDRAIDALLHAGLPVERTGHIATEIHQLYDLERQVREEGAQLKQQVEKVYKAGDTPQSLAAKIVWPSIVKADIYAARVIELAEGKPLTPVIPPEEPKPIEEPLDPKPIEGEEEIIKP